MRLSLSLRILLFPLAWEIFSTTSSATAEGEGGDSTTACDCTGCSDVHALRAGANATIVNEPPCPEGSVASVLFAKVSSSVAPSGGIPPPIRVTTSNIGGMYVYRDSSSDNTTTCYSAVPDDTGRVVVGDQTVIQVSVSCESDSEEVCAVQWMAEFGCAETGVLVEDAGGGVQVLSDIDSTMVAPNRDCKPPEDCGEQNVSTLTTLRSGVDKRLEHGEFYPGVGELLLGLALGPESEAMNYVPSKPIFFPARPGEAEKAHMLSQNGKLNLYLEAIGKINSYTSWGGNVDSSLGIEPSKLSHTEFGKMKARSYETISAERPNTRFAFLGDNGQDDACAARSMLESGVGGDRMVAVFLHRAPQLPDDTLVANCKHLNGTYVELNLPLEGDRVHYHKTYSDATKWALDQSLLSCRSAERVYEAVAMWQSCICPNRSINDGGFSSNCTHYNAPREKTTLCADVAVDQASLIDSLKDSCMDGYVVDAEPRFYFNDEADVLLLSAGTSLVAATTMWMVVMTGTGVLFALFGGIF